MIIQSVEKASKSSAARFPPPPPPDFAEKLRNTVLLSTSAFFKYNFKQFHSSGQYQELISFKISKFLLGLQKTRKEKREVYFLCLMLFS